MDFLEFPKINKNAYLENCNFQKKKKKKSCFLFNSNNKQKDYELDQNFCKKND